MAMHKKDYEVIATVVRQFDDDVRPKMFRLFAGQLKLTNPRFDVIKFAEACGVIE